MNRLVLPLAVYACVFVAACGDDGDGDTTKTVIYTGNLLNGVDQKPIAGARACFVSHPDIPCFDTGADGSYSVELPAETKVEVEVVKDGFIGVRANFITRSTDFPLSAYMFPPAAIELGFTAVGADFDLTKGGLLVRVYDPANGSTSGLAGVAVDIEPSDGVGPFYANGVAFEKDATATAAGGNAIFGGLADKTYRVSFESATHDCVGTYHWKSSDGRLEAKIKAGFATYMYVDCPAK